MDRSESAPRLDGGCASERDSLGKIVTEFWDGIQGTEKEPGEWRMALAFLILPLAAIIEAVVA